MNVSKGRKAKTATTGIASMIAMAGVCVRTGIALATKAGSEYHASGLNATSTASAGGNAMTVSASVRRATSVTSVKIASARTNTTTMASASTRSAGAMQRSTLTLASSSFVLPGACSGESVKMLAGRSKSASVRKDGVEMVVQ